MIFQLIYLRKAIAFLLLFVVLNSYAWNDISRGQQSGELYFASVWYWLNEEESFNVICYTDDYGQSLSFKYICNVFNPNDMLPYNILNGKTDGLFYNYVHQPSPKIYISHDLCHTWEECTGLNAPSNFYTSGNEVGVVYTRSGQNPGLYKSYDSAHTFEHVKGDSVYGFLEVGTEPAEIYFSYGPSQYHDFEIYYSNNGGESFTLINSFDSTIAGYNLQGHYPRIFRGTEEGEVYLVSWFLSEKFKIFYSADYGANFELRYTSPQCDFYYEGYNFTPGFDQGTFYYIKGLPWYDNINTKVHIFYSSDTAKTFTEHIHILDSTFPVSIYDDNIIKNKRIDLTNYPNPFALNTTICFNTAQSDNYTIELTTLSGQMVLCKNEYLNAGQQYFELSTDLLPPAIYLCTVKMNKQIIGVTKIIKAR